MAASDLALEDQKAVDAIVATLVYHVRKEHPRPTASDPARRDAHPKHHGCVKAILTTEKALPAHLAQGLFSRPGPYECWVRFSNAFKVRHDLDRDARGMAIKVLGVDDAAHGEGTQDFLLVTHKVFFAKDPVDFLDFPAAVAGAGSTTDLYSRTIGFFFGLRPFRFRWRGFMALQRSLNLCTNPLVRTYLSQVPYQYGSRQAKFRARPRQRGNVLDWLRLWFRVVFHAITSLVESAVRTVRPAFHWKVNDWWKDSLHEALLARLRGNTASFAIEVQIRGAGDPDIDDALTPWRASRYVQVASLEIPRLPADMDVKTMMTFAEHLSYTPWHHVPAHEPLGSINLARRAVYDAISTVRHHVNHKPRREPRSGESQKEYLRAIEGPEPLGSETRTPPAD